MKLKKRSGSLFLGIGGRLVYTSLTWFIGVCFLVKSTDSIEISSVALTPSPTPGLFLTLLSVVVLLQGSELPPKRSPEASHIFAPVLANASLQTPVLLLLNSKSVKEPKHPPSLPTEPLPSPQPGNDSRRRLSKVPKGRRRKYEGDGGSSRKGDKRLKKVSRLGRAKNRARLLLGSLNRRNCFAKVLCGIGARPPSTKTDLVNDYVYLMEELLLDEEEEEPEKSAYKKKKLKEFVGKGKKGVGKGQTKKEDSDSSQSKSEEESDKEGDLASLAEGEMAASDPDVLKYVRLEQKRKEFKNALRATAPSFIAKRRGVAGDPDPPNHTLFGNYASRPRRRRGPPGRRIPVAKARKLLNQMEAAVNVGRSFGGSRQCRTIFEQCPLDDKQMDIIITNVRKLMEGKGAATEGPSTSTASRPLRPPKVPSGSKTTVSDSQSGNNGGTKVEIVVHLNQNGVPNVGGYPIVYPGGQGNPYGGQTPAGINFPIGQQPGQLSPSTLADPAPPCSSESKGVSPSSLEASSPPISDLSSSHLNPYLISSAAPPSAAALPVQPISTNPQPMLTPKIPTALVNSNEYIETPLLQPLKEPVTTPPIKETTEAPSTTTTSTASPAADEQLLDFLYGVVNFNESTAGDPSPPLFLRNPNPFYPTGPTASAAVEPLPLSIFDDIDTETRLKVKSKPKIPSWTADDDEDSDSKSSEEVDLKEYLYSLRETLTGLAQMNNATLAVETKAVKSSEEDDDSSPEDVLNDPFPMPGEADLGGLDSDEEFKHKPSKESEENSRDKEVDLKVPGGKKEKKGNKRKSPPKKGSKPLIASTTRRPTPPSGGQSDEIFDNDSLSNDDPDSSFGPGRDHSKPDWSSFETGSSNESSKKKGKKKPSWKPVPEDDEFEPEDSNESNNGGDTLGGDDDEEDDPGDEIEDEVDEASEESSPGKGRTPPKITVKFQPSSSDDMGEMTPKDKKKLQALSNILIPTPPPRRPLKKHKPVRDTLEEVKLPHVKPVAKDFQRVVSMGGDNTEVINIDEFAEDSGKTPNFPRRKKDKRRPMKNYMKTRKPPATRPMLANPADSSQLQDDEPQGQSSEEEDEDENDEARMGSIGSKPRKRSKIKNSGPLIAIPPQFNPHDIYNTEHESAYAYVLPEEQQHHPFSEESDQFDFVGSVYDLIGMKPSNQPDRSNQQHQRPHPQGGEYNSMMNNRPYIVQMAPEPSGHGPYDRFKSDQPHPQPTTHFLNLPDNIGPQPKIAINVPMMPQGSNPHRPSGETPQNDDVPEDEEPKGDKDKDKGKDKDKDKKDGDEKDKGKKEKKKKGGDDDEEGGMGYSHQFHQQVYPPKESEIGLWDQIKGFFNDKLGSLKDPKETPFIQVGFQNADPSHSEGDHSGGSDYAGKSQEISQPHQEQHNYGPSFGSAEDEEEDEEGEDEEGDEEEEEDDLGGSDVSSDQTEIRNNSSVPSSPPPTTSLPPPVSTVDPKLVIPIKSTIAPKASKYKVNRKKISNRRRKGPKTTTGVPISLFTTTTEPPPTTRPTVTSPYRKPARRKVNYKLGGRLPNKNSGDILTTYSLGVAVSSTTTPAPPKRKARPTSVPPEDDEVEPPSHFFQPGPKGQNVRGRPPVHIGAFHAQSEDMLVESPFEEEELRRRSDPGLFQRRKPQRENRQRYGQGHYGQRPGSEDAAGGDSSPITHAIMTSSIFSNHFKHLYTKFTSLG